MILTYEQEQVFLSDLHYQLGSVRRELEQLAVEGLIAGSTDVLRAVGYQYAFSASPDETLLDLASKPLIAALKHRPAPGMLVFQHSNAESAVIRWSETEADLAQRNRYFPPLLMKHLELDHIPYLCSFASGCAGFIASLVIAAGVLRGSDQQLAGCVLADKSPAGVTFDMRNERILGSDHSSAFLVGRERRGYQLLATTFYSTTRAQVPLLEIVKRTVAMIQGMAQKLRLDLRQQNVAIHYPNIFPDAWRMVTKYTAIPQVEHVVDDMAERAHCGGSDSVISLAKQHRRHEGKLHFVVNYGLGLHLAVGLLREEAAADA